MRTLKIALTLSLLAAPGLANAFSFDLPRLDWPTTETVTGSTKGCTLSIEAPHVPACN